MVRAHIHIDVDSLIRDNLKRLGFCPNTPQVYGLAHPGCNFPAAAPCVGSLFVCCNPNDHFRAADREKAKAALAVWLREPTMTKAREAQLPGPLGHTKVAATTRGSCPAGC